MRSNHSSGGPPPPPIKKKNRQAVTASSAAGAGFNFATNSRLHNSKRSSAGIEGPCANLYDIVPDTTIGFGVEVNGDMEFSHLLRIDGKFKGRLSVSQNGDNSPSIITDNMGDLIIGEHGILIGDVGDSCNIRCMMMEGGEVIGNISVEELVLLNNAKVSGKITAKFCTIGENAVVFTGGESVNIHPQAPEVVDDLVLGHSESNESLIFKQELDNSPYASKPNQKRQVVMEKKRHREMYPDPAQPLFEVPAVFALPAIPAKLLALWKNDRALGNGGEGRDASGSQQNKAQSSIPIDEINYSSNAGVTLTSTNNNQREQDVGQKPSLSPVHISRETAPEEVQKDDDEDDSYGDAGEDCKSPSAETLFTAVSSRENPAVATIPVVEPARIEAVQETVDTETKPEYENDEYDEDQEDSSRPPYSARNLNEEEPRKKVEEDDGVISQQAVTDDKVDEPVVNDVSGDGHQKEDSSRQPNSARNLVAEEPGTKVVGEEGVIPQQSAVEDKKDVPVDEISTTVHPKPIAVDSGEGESSGDGNGDPNYEEDPKEEGEIEATNEREDKNCGDQVHYSICLSKIALRLETKPDASHIFRVDGSFPASSSAWSTTTPSLDPSDLPSGMHELLEWDCGLLPGMEFVATATEVASQPFKLSISKNLLSAEAEEWTVLAEGSIKLSERLSISTVRAGEEGVGSSSVSDELTQVHQLRFPFFFQENAEQLFATATVLFNMSAMYIAKL